MARLLLAILFLIPPALFSQTGRPFHSEGNLSRRALGETGEPRPDAVGTGSIRGQVTDASTGDVLVVANVIIVGSKPGYGAASDMNGMFLIYKIPPGEYTVRASYLEYQTVTVQKVKVEAGKTTETNFVMRKEGEAEPEGEKSVDSSASRKDRAGEASADSVKR